MWKHVFNTNQSKVLWRDRSTAARAAHSAGYKFMNWNGWILFVVNADGDAADTGIMVEEIENGFKSIT